jgi:molecular chaperone GrpE
MKEEEIIYSEDLKKEGESIIKIEDRFDPLISDVEKEINESDMVYVESTEDGDELPTKDAIKKLREDLKICRKEKEEYLTGWQRAKADYINLQKESEQIRSNTSIFTKERIINDFLPAIDSFDMAFENKEAWEKVDKNWRMGVEYIHLQFIKVLSDLGIDKIETIGILFDPNIHNSVEIVETDDESKDHTIEKIVQVGYKMGERIIRPASVRIYEYKK